MAARFCVLIPAYQPDQRLTLLVEKLQADGLPVLVVDDGSTGCEQVFADVQALGAEVLHHDGNRGKGCAIRTGLRRLDSEGYTGTVTADADGQHTPQDIRRVLQALEQNPDYLILGARQVEKMPPRSRIGNALTRALFAALYSIRLQDTQTGLRAFALHPPGDNLADIPGDRYEYEMNQLILSQRLFAGIREIPIETIYIGANETSHFRPLADGTRIYGCLFRRLPGFLISSLSSFCLDYALFALFFYRVFHAAVPATVVARLFSASENYLVNKKLVFRAGSRRYTAGFYFALAAGILAVNSALMFVLVDWLQLPALLMKVLVECLLYCVSFAVQNSRAFSGDPTQSGRKRDK